MILSRNNLKELLNEGVIQNAREEQIQGASIDLTLGDKILIESDEGGTVTSDSPLKTKEVSIKDTPYILRPHEFVLAHTVEKFNIPDNLCGIYYMNSSMARNGLQHMLATFCDPCWNNSVLTLELQNALSNHSIELISEMRIGQMVFHTVTEPVDYNNSYATRGRYNGDNSVSGIKNLTNKE